MTETAVSVLAPGMSIKVEEAPEMPTKTFALDLDNGRIAGYVDGVEAVKQAAMVMLLSERFDTLIFDPQFGSELDDIIGYEDVTQEFRDAEIRRAIPDALMRDGRILGVDSIEASYSDDNAHIRVWLNTVYGETDLEVRF